MIDTKRLIIIKKKHSIFIRLSDNCNTKILLTSVVRPGQSRSVDSDFNGFYVVGHQHYLVFALNCDGER